MTPRFSIIIPAFNAELTLAQTLAAVSAQIFSDWECIVVDDGSTDGTCALARTFVEADSRFRLVAQANTGTGGAYNTGIRQSIGAYIVICSADDVLLPLHLTTVSAFIESRPGYDIFTTNGYVWTASGQKHMRYSEKQDESSLELADVIAECPYGIGAVYRREVFDEIGGYRIDVFGEDYDFWLRALASGAKHRYIPAVLSMHRVGEGQKSARREDWWRSDIRIVSDLLASFALSERDARTARALIDNRKRRILRLRSPFLDSLQRLPGAATALRLLHSIRLSWPRRLRRG